MSASLQTAERAMPLARLVDRLQLAARPAAIAGGFLPSQRVDVLVLCPTTAAELRTRLLRTLPGARLHRNYVIDHKLALQNADALLWVNKRGAPLVVRVRSRFECFALDRPAPRVVVCSVAATRAQLDAFALASDWHGACVQLLACEPDQAPLDAKSACAANESVK